MQILLLIALLCILYLVVTLIYDLVKWFRSKTGGASDVHIKEKCPERANSSNLNTPLDALKPDKPATQPKNVPAKTQQREKPARRKGPNIQQSSTAVLRRQVPVDFSQTPHSWLGGLPQMPEDVAWPTHVSVEYPERGETPLHFAGQISCRHLPEDLWGGLGPRAGWLLVFVDLQASLIEDHSDAVQVIHVNELGPERAPPEGIMPVCNLQYSGYHYPHVLETNLPTKLRKWPIDICRFENELPGPDRLTAQMLYPDQNIGEHSNYGYASSIKDVTDKQTWPFTWRGALYVIDGIERAWQKSKYAGWSTNDWRQFEVEGFHDKALEAIAEEIETIQTALATVKGSEDRWRKHMRGEIAKLEASHRFLEAHPDKDELRARISEIDKEFVAWGQALPPCIAELRAEILEHDLDTTMSEKAFSPIFNRLDAEKIPFCSMAFLKNDPPFVYYPRVGEKSLLTNVGRFFGEAQLQTAADFYVASEARRAMIPTHLLKPFESGWRHLGFGHPHRMGGYQDPVQTPPLSKPNEVLLIQLASDPAMPWVPADIYVVIETGDLERCDFSRLVAWSEHS